MKPSITFNDLRKATDKRTPLFTNDANTNFQDPKLGGDWTVSDWFMALTGEVGELANKLKKVKRGDLNLQDHYTKKDIGKEFGDIIIYLDCLASLLNYDLGYCTMDAFNSKSIEKNIPVFLGKRARPPKREKTYDAT